MIRAYLIASAMAVLGMLLVAFPVALYAVIIWAIYRLVTHFCG